MEFDYESNDGWPTFYTTMNSKDFSNNNEETSTKEITTNQQKETNEEYPTKKVVELFTDSLPTEITLFDISIESIIT